MPFEAVPILPITGGQKEDQPKQLIKRVFSPEISDVIYENGKVTTRGGLVKEFTDDLLSPVRHETVYKTFSGDELLLIFTTLDVYQFDATNNKPNFITPTYTTGTIDVTNGSKTVAGNGTLFDTTVDGRKNVRPGDFIRIGAINDASPVWYEVDTITNDTSLELVIAYAQTTDTTVAYTNRQVFATTSTSTWRTSNFTDATLGDIIVGVNGPDGDFPVYWDGAGQMRILKNSNKAKDVGTLAGRLLLFHTLVSASNQTQRYEWSAVGDAETWAAADFADITETQGKIIGAELFGAGNHIIIGKNDSKFQLRWVGGDFTFDHQLIDRTGVLSAHGMENIPGVGLFYFGSDLRFRIYNGATDEDIGKNIFPSINSITPANFELVYSKFIPHKKELRVHVPIGDVTVNTHTFVMRTDFFTWWPWEYKKASSIACTEVFSTLATLFVDDSPWDNRFVDEHDGFWDDREFLENSPVVYYGGDDNFFRRADTGLDDDGTAYTPRFQTKNDDFGHPQHEKRLWKYQIWADSEVGKSLNVSVRRSDAIGFEASKSVSIDDTSKDVVKVNTPVFDAHGNVFETKIEATPPWTLHGLWAYIKRLKKTV